MVERPLRVDSREPEPRCLSSEISRPSRALRRTSSRRQRNCRCSRRSVAPECRDCCQPGCQARLVAADSYLSVNGESCRDDEADYADRLFHCSMLPTEKFERKDSELVFRAAHCAPPCLKPQEFLKVIAIKLLLRLRSASPSVKPLVLLEFCRERSAPSAETRSLQLPVVI